MAAQPVAGEHPVNCAQHLSAAPEQASPAAPASPSEANSCQPCCPAAPCSSRRQRSESCAELLAIHSSTKRPKMSRLFSRKLASAYLCLAGGGGEAGSLAGVSSCAAVLLQLSHMPPGRCLPCSTAPPTQPSSPRPHRCTKFCSLPTASTRRMAASVGAGGGCRDSTLRRCLMMPCGERACDAAGRHGLEGSLLGCGWECGLGI